MLDTIVKNNKQGAVKSIIINSDILFQEKSTKCISLIVTMILFWNKDLNIDFPEVLFDAKDSVKELYEQAIENKLSFINDSEKDRVKNILKKIRRVD